MCRGRLDLGIARAGGIGSALVETVGDYWAPCPSGRPMLLLPVYESPHKLGDLTDVIAFEPSRPMRWFVRTGGARALGSWTIDVTRSATPMWKLPGDEPPALRIYRHPINWLRASCAGAVILHPSWSAYLLHRLRVVPEDVLHGRAIKASCELASVPEILIQVDEATVAA